MKKKKTSWFLVPLFASGIILGLAYIRDPQEVQKFLKVLFRSPNSETIETLKTPSVEPTPEAELTSQAAINAKRNAEVFREIYEVIFAKEPKDRGEFGNWVDTLNQGASLEGVYNGLVYSKEYRRLETIGDSASAEALRVFGEELALLEVELPNPTRFVRESGSSELVPAPAPAPSTVSMVQPTPEPTPAMLAEGYSKQFIGASIYTLKRVLGAEALKIVSSKSEYREKQAFWYSKWVARIARKNVDFGLVLRNKPDEALHFKWAVENSEDRLKWEVLNRLHRVLNEANKPKH